MWTGISLSLLAGLVVFMLSFQKVKQQKRIISSQNQVKDKMFSVIGHDLRNPIANILAILELFEKGYVTEAELKENIYKLKNQTTNLQNTMHNLLLWATSQMKGDKQHIESLNIAENITEVVDFYDSVAKQKNIQLLTSVETTQKVQADQNQLHAILRNLISNAIKFTPSGGKVTATAKAGEAGKVLIRIQDTGVGMTYEETQKLFNLPTHFSKVGTNKEKGTGLGLLLVKEFVEANKGTIRVLSTPQKGTTFEITLPA